MKAPPVLMPRGGTEAIRHEATYLALLILHVQKVGNDRPIPKSIKLMAAAEQLSAALQLFSHSCSVQS